MLAPPVVWLMVFLAPQIGVTLSVLLGGFVALALVVLTDRFSDSQVSSRGHASSGSTGIGTTALESGSSGGQMPQVMFDHPGAARVLQVAGIINCLALGVLAILSVWMFVDPSSDPIGSVMGPIIGFILAVVVLVLSPFAIPMVIDGTTAVRGELLRKKAGNRGLLSFSAGLVMLLLAFPFVSVSPVFELLTLVPAGFALSNMVVGLVVWRLARDPQSIRKAPPNPGFNSTRA
ncbi:MAG: hypothetical protein KJ747_01990 [Actinobacteria bacterium]|nr:hypothetical protein [Actinomycetota bacterium]